MFLQFWKSFLFFPIKLCFPKAFARVKAISGDVGEENLGLSESDRQILTQNINVVFHSAATLDFAETLKSTVNVNLLGTRRMLQLAEQCRQLKAFVHVSSAYVNSYKTAAEEVISQKNNILDCICTGCTSVANLREFRSYLVSLEKNIVWLLGKPLQIILFWIETVGISA